MLAVAYLQYKQILGTSRVWALLILLGLPIGLTLLVVEAGGFMVENDVEANGIYLFLLYPFVLSALLAILYGTMALNNEVEGKTITYLFTRPLPRWKVVVSKYLAISAVLSIGLCGSLLSSWVLLGGPGGVRMFGAMSTAVCAAMLAYCGLYVALGVLLTKRPMMVGLIYALLMEGMLSFVPAVINKMSITYYVRSLALSIYGKPDLVLPPRVEGITGDASVAGSIFALCLFILGGLALASIVASLREYPANEQV